MCIEGDLNAHNKVVYLFTHSQYNISVAIDLIKEDILLGISDIYQMRSTLHYGTSIFFSVYF